MLDILRTHSFSYITNYRRNLILCFLGKRSRVIYRVLHIEKEFGGYSLNGWSTYMYTSERKPCLLCANRTWKSRHHKNIDSFVIVLIHFVSVGPGNLHFLYPG